MDEGFNIKHGPLFGWWGRLRVYGLVRTSGHIVQALLNDAKALGNFINANPRTVKAVTVLVHRYFKVELVIPAIGFVTAPVEIHSCCPQAWARNTPVQGFIFSVNTNTVGSLAQDAVLHHHIFILFQPLGHPVEKIANHDIPTVGQVLRDPANAEPGRMHAPAGYCLDNPEQSLSVTEHIKNRRHLPNVLGESTVENKVAGDAEELRHHDANDFCSIRHFNTGHLLNRHDVGQVVHDTAQVINTIGVGDVGMPGLPFSHLFSAAMVVTDFRHSIDNHFSVELQHNTEHTVNGGMVRPKIEEHKFCIFVAPGHPPFFRLEAQCLLLLVLSLEVHAKWLHLSRAGRVVFPESVTLPGGWQQDAVKVGVVCEGDAKHVPGFTFIPIGIRVNVMDAGYI